MKTILRLMLVLMLSGLYSCNDNKRHIVNYLTDGYNTPVPAKFIGDDGTLTDVQLPPRSELHDYKYVDYSPDQKSYFEVSLVSDTLTNYLVERRFLHYYIVEYERRDENGAVDWYPVKTTAEKLDEAGSGLSAAVLSGIDRLHQFKWDLPALPIALVTAICAYWLFALCWWNMKKDLDFQSNRWYTIVPFVVMVLGCLWLFCICEPFSDDDPTQGNVSIVGLFLLPGLLLAVLGQWYFYPLILGETLPFYDGSDDLKYLRRQLISFGVFGFLWLVLVWLYKPFADYALFLLIIYIIVSLGAVMIKGFRGGQIWLTLLYAICFPLFCIVFFATAITMGLLCLMIAVTIIAVSALFSQPSMESSGYKIKNRYGQTIDYADSSGYSKDTGTHYNI